MFSHVLVVVNMYEVEYNSFTIKNIPVDGTWNLRFNGYCYVICSHALLIHSDDKKYSSLYGGFGVAQGPMPVTNGVGTIQIPQYSILIYSM
jgi:hypothetical protein